VAKEREVAKHRDGWLRKPWVVNEGWVAKYRMSDKAEG
jgi:hypothetical protein